METGTNRRLASTLEHALTESGIDLETLHSRTRVPMTTLEGLFGRSHEFEAPPRPYLKGQLVLICRELGLAKEELLELFDAAFESANEVSDEPKPQILGMAVACGLGGVSILAIVLAFVA